MRKLFVEKNHKLRNLGSIFITFLVISLLVFSGPAQAITLGITDVSNSTPSGNTAISFLAKADIHTNDRVPLKNVTVNIRYTNNTIKEKCTFDLDGTALTTCTNFVISKLSGKINYSASTEGYGYGYGESAYQNISFGYGYTNYDGYGYDAFSDTIMAGSTSTTAEFIFNVTYTTPTLASTTQFNIDASTTANDGTTNAAYTTKTSTSITVLENTAPIIQGITIIPTTAYTNSTLNCSATYVDAGNKVNATFYWYNGSTLYGTPSTKLNLEIGSALISDTLTAGIQARGETWNCTMLVVDAVGNTGSLASTTRTITNYAPILASIGNKQVNATEKLNFTISATDWDSNDVLNYSISAANISTNISSWASLNATSTNLTLAGTATALQNGTYNATFVVSDGSLTDYELIFITVLSSAQEYASNQTESIVNGTTEIVFNGGSNTVENITIPSTVTANQSITLNLNALLNSSQDIEINTRNLTLTRETSSANYSAEIQNGTIISGNLTWDGKITMPTVKTASDYSVSGGTIDTVIDLGTSAELNFSKAVKITIGGQAGKVAAWGRGTTLTTITTQCDSATSPTNIDSATTRECYIDSGNDLVIWTYHFTEFAAYTASAATTTTTSSSSGGSSQGTVYDIGSLTAVSKELAIGEKIKFSIEDKTNHTLSLLGMTASSATIQVTALTTTLTKSFTLNQAQTLDINRDGKDDIEVTLTGLSVGTGGSKSKATFSVRSLNVAAGTQPTTPAENVTTPTTPPETTTPPVTPPTKPITPVGWKWVLIGAIAVILIIVVILFRNLKKKPF